VIKPETAKALAELGRAAARQIGIPDDIPITMSICPDREYEWCGLVDGEPIEANSQIQLSDAAADTAL